MSTRWTEADLARLQQKPVLSASQVALASRSPHKYRNEPVIENGERYDSKLEARCARWLDLRKASGEVAWYLRQVSFRLEGSVRYRADYLVVLASGGVEVIDATGFTTPAKSNKLKQVKARYGVDVLLWKG